MHLAGQPVPGAGAQADRPGVAIGSTARRICRCNQELPAGSAATKPCCQHASAR
jgi:hypothetical protein